jgi:Zn ribbon nucleic-acid-binding protein
MNRCARCGRFAHRSIIGIVCHACLARDAGFPNLAAWREAMIARSERAVAEWEALVAR